MLKHIVTWTVKKDVENPEVVKERIKAKLEALKNEIPELQSIQVVTTLESSSTHDIVLFSEFKNTEDLNIYALHPKHIEVAEKEIKPYLENRCCMDFIE